MPSDRPPQDEEEVLTGIELEPDSISIDGEPEEAIDEITRRIDELEAVVPELADDDPQRRIIGFELNILRKAREALEREQ